MIKNFAELDKLAVEMSAGSPKIIAVAAAAEDHVLHAVCEAKNKGIADAILVGNESDILRVSIEAGLDISAFRIIHEEDATIAAQIAVELVRTGEAQMLMKGLLDTSVFLKAVLDKEHGLREGKLLSFVGIFEISGYDRLILLSDPAINLEPELEERDLIMKNAVSVAKALGIACPKVAFVSPVEKVNPRMASTIQAHALVEKYQDRTDFQVGGPFGLDNAINEEAAVIKGLSGPVAGKADILILADIGVGNVLYKSLIYFAHATSGSIVVGAKAPVLITSRSDSIETKLNTIKVGVVLSDRYAQL